MSDLNKDNWLQKLFIDQAKPALDRHGSSGGSGSDSVKYSEGLEIGPGPCISRFGCEVIGIGTCKDKDVVIPPTHNGRLVTEICYGGLESNIQITSVVIPDSVFVIDGDAFYGCNSLTSVVIGANVEEIYETAFSGAFYLKRVDFSKHTFIPRIESDSFDDTHNDLQIKVPANLIDEWKASTNWSDYADKIVTEFTN